MTERREFLARVAAGGAALAAAAIDPLVAAAQVAATSTTSVQVQTTTWDDTWATALGAGKYKAVIDAPEVEEGGMFWYARAFIDGCKQALGAAPGETQVAVVIRHAAIPLAYGDAIWAKYQLGKKLKITDPVTNKKAIRNPYLSLPDGHPDMAWMAPMTILALGAEGVSFPCCNRATRFLASQIAGWTKQDRNTVYEELKANLVPGARLQPTGLYATMRAQQLGAAFMRS
ncbi:MAG: twin-arginine translocation signal domain-containing protein [Gemmatimonadota bacterium]